MVGIVVLNYNSAKDTLKCIASIEKFTALTYKVYIVDGNSKDNSYDVLSKHFWDHPNICILKSDINGGYSYGNNVGIKRAVEDGVDTLLVMNPDVILCNDAIGIMHEALYNNDDVAVVGPRIFGPDNKDMHFAAKPLTFSNFSLNRKPVNYLNKRKFRELRYHNIYPSKDLKFQGMVSGCCFMIKTSVFQKIKFFDEKIFLYHEEDILAYKILGKRMLSMISTRAEVIHNHSSTVKKEGMAFFRFHRSVSAYYVLKKYVKINPLQSFLTSLLITVPFLGLSVFDKSYRVLARPLINKIYINKY